METDLVYYSSPVKIAKRNRRKFIFNLITSNAIFIMVFTIVTLRNHFDWSYWPNILYAVLYFVFIFYFANRFQYGLKKTKLVITDTEVNLSYEHYMLGSMRVSEIETIELTKRGLILKNFFNSNRIIIPNLFDNLDDIKQVIERLVAC